jgi:hypothetical protein
MAVKKSAVRQTFYEVVFQGKPKVVRAFLTGFIMGNVDDATVFYNFTDGIFHEGKTEKLKEMVGIRGTDCHVVVDASTSGLLKKMKKKIEAQTGLAITSHRSIRSASMEFCFQAFAPKYNEEIVHLVRTLPAGLKIQGFKHDVRLDPKAKGIEAYSPAHHYEAKGEATITGRIDLLVDLKRRFADYPLINAEDIVLNLA